jgi:hypothetical protein
MKLFNKNKAEDDKQEVNNEKCVWIGSLIGNHGIFITSCGTTAYVAVKDINYAPVFCDLCGRLVEYRK